MLIAFHTEVEIQLLGTVHICSYLTAQPFKHISRSDQAVKQKAKSHWK